MINCVASGNGGDGIRIEGAHDIELTGVRSSNNGGKGINVVQPNHDIEIEGGRRDSKLSAFFWSVAAAALAAIIAAPFIK